MESHAPRLQDLLVELNLVSTSQINEALFVSGTSSVLGALEHYLPPEEFKLLLKILGSELGMPIQEFSPKVLDRNIDLRDAERFKELVQQHRSLPLNMEGDGQPTAVVLAVTDPLNEIQFIEWSELYGLAVKPKLVAESDLRKFTLALSSKLPLAARPKLDDSILAVPVTSGHDPEVEQIIGELIFAAARRNLNAIALSNCEGVTRVSLAAAAEKARWRIPIVFEKAINWLESISVEAEDSNRNAVLHREDLEIRFGYNQSPDSITISHPRFYFGEIDGIESEVEQSANSTTIVVAADRNDSMPSSWQLLKNDPSVRLSRNRSDTLITALFDQPTMIIVDYDFPELNAAELLKNLHDNLSNAKILVVLPENKMELSDGLKAIGETECIPSSQLREQIKDYLKV